jgi:hypothetical protein
VAEQCGDAPPSKLNIHIVQGDLDIALLSMNGSLMKE